MQYCLHLQCQHLVPFLQAQFTQLNSRVDAHDRAIAAQDVVIASLQAKTISPASQLLAGWQRQCNVPQAENHFMGRDAVLQGLQQLVSEKAHRLIVVLGAIGMVRPFCCSYAPHSSKHSRHSVMLCSLCRATPILLDLFVVSRGTYAVVLCLLSSTCMNANQRDVSAC